MSEKNTVNVVAGIICKNEKILLAKRPLTKHQGGLWEFPGGKVYQAESKENALYRECLEELDIRISKPRFFDHVDHDYGDKLVSISFFLVTTYSGQEKGNEGQEISWVSLESLKEKKFPEANQKIVSQLNKKVILEYK